MEYQQFLELAKAAGVPGLILAAVILLLVYVAKWGGLVKNGNWARFINFGLAFLLAGVKIGNQETALVAAIGSVLSALAYETIEAIKNKKK